MYTNRERIVRDGRLIAFEGEEMTDQEADARGLTVTGDAKKAEEPDEGERTGESERTDVEDGSEGPAEATPKQARPRRKPRQGQE